MVSSTTQKFYRYIVMYNPRLQRYFSDVENPFEFLLRQNPAEYDAVLDAVVSVFARLSDKYREALVTERRDYHQQLKNYRARLSDQSINWTEYVARSGALYVTYVRNVMRIVGEIV